jgi:uncharacterized membrane protein (DUF4010 family)
LTGAIQMALAFQAAMTVLGLVHAMWGTGGLYATAVMLGLTDMDALTVSMSRLDGDVTTRIAANAIVIGMLSNTVLKATVAGVIGRGRFRTVTVRGLVVLGVALAVGLLSWW